MDSPKTETPEKQNGPAGENAVAQPAQETTAEESTESVKTTTAFQTDTTESAEAAAEDTFVEPALEENFSDNKEPSDEEKSENKVPPKEKPAQKNTKQPAKSASKNKKQKPVQKAAKERVEPKKNAPPQKPAAKKHSRKHSAAVPLGGLFVLLAVIGLITVIVFGVRATENLIDNSKQKQEFGNTIFPVLMFDPIPFEDPGEMGDLALLRSSIWSAIISNSEKYSVGEGNMVSVPQSDVDVACAKLFGEGITLQHRAFEDYLSVYSFDENTKTYFVPVDATILYTPQVEEIKRNGNTFELLVGYIAPDNEWMQTIKGETAEPTPSKYMIYDLEKTGDHYQLIAIKDPPDGAVPGMPQIFDHNDTTPSENTQPIEPSKVEQTEQSDQSEAVA